MVFDLHRQHKKDKMHPPCCSRQKIEKVHTPLALLHTPSPALPNCKGVFFYLPACYVQNFEQSIWCVVLRNSFKVTGEQEMRKKLTEKEWKKAMENVMHYRAAMAVFTIWLDRGYIIPEEFRRIDDKTAEKYKIHQHSIYRYNDWTYKKPDTQFHPGA